MSVRKALKKLRKWERYCGRYQCMGTEPNPYHAQSKGWRRAAIRYAEQSNRWVEVKRPE